MVVMVVGGVGVCVGGGGGDGGGGEGGGDPKDFFEHKKLGAGQL